LNPSQKGGGLAFLRGMRRRPKGLNRDLAAKKKKTPGKSVNGKKCGNLVKRS